MFLFLNIQLVQLNFIQVYKSVLIITHNDVFIFIYLFSLVFFLK